MTKTVIRCRFISSWRIGETESWLADMSAKGLHLKSFIGRQFARFEKGEAQDYRYRVDVAVERQGIIAEQKSFYQEFGWEYVCGDWDTGIFRIPASVDAPELHTDPSELAIPLRKIRRKSILTLAILPLFLLFWLCFVPYYLIIPYNRTPVLLILSSGGGIFFMYTFLALSGILESLKSAAAIRGVNRSLRSGKAIDHQADWRPYHRRGKIFFIFIQSMILLSLAYGIASLLSSRPQNLPAIAESNPPLLRLADVEKNPALVRRAGYHSDGVDTANSLTRSWSPFARSIARLVETGTITGETGYDASLNFELYHLRLGFLGDPLIADLMLRSERIPPLSGPVVEIAHPELFDCLYTKTLPGDAAYSPRYEAFARKGSYVLYVCYSGYQDGESVLRALRDLFAEV